MSAESKLQSEIIRYLKNKGAYVIKTRPQPGIPAGCPDIIFMLEGFWGAIESKASAKAPYQPLQKETLEKFNEWSWSKTVYPSNWSDVKIELEQML